MESTLPAAAVRFSLHISTAIFDASSTLSSDKKTILWQPTSSAQQLIGEMASELSVLSYPPRVLARLAIKGNMILSDAATPLHLDGDAFFDASGARADSLSGDGSRGGTYETYFWLTWDVLLTFPNGSITSPTQPVLAAWVASTKYALNDIVLDSHGNLEQASVAGTSGATVPPWPATFTDGTIDGTTGLTWCSKPLRAILALWRECSQSHPDDSRNQCQQRRGNYPRGTHFGLNQNICA